MGSRLPISREGHDMESISICDRKPQSSLGIAFDSQHDHLPFRGCRGRSLGRPRPDQPSLGLAPRSEE